MKIANNNEDVHQKCKIQSLNHLPQMHTFASMRSTPFMEIDDKGEEIVQRYETLDMKALRLRLYKRDKIRYESFGRD